MLGLKRPYCVVSHFHDRVSINLFIRNESRDADVFASVTRYMIHTNVRVLGQREAPLLLLSAERESISQLACNPKCGQSALPATRDAAPKMSCPRFSATDTEGGKTRNAVKRG
jgi:hypothetical protein